MGKYTEKKFMFHPDEGNLLLTFNFTNTYIDEFIFKTTGEEVEYDEGDNEYSVWVDCDTFDEIREFLFIQGFTPEEGSLWENSK